MSRWFDVTMFEDDRLIVVRVSARGTVHAVRKASELCPDAVVMGCDPASKRGQK